MLTTSSGTFSQELAAGDDVYQAMTGPSGVGISTFRTSSGEMVMAITELVPYAADGIAAMRLVTSLTLVDQQMMQYTLISLGLALMVMGVSLWSGLFFVRSIVIPLGRVEETATRIAAGDLTRPPAGQPLQRRDRPPVRHHQPDGRGPAETEEMIHLLGEP